MSFGNTNNINSFKFFKYLINIDFFFKKSHTKINLLCNITTINLDFINSGFFCFLIKFLWLSVTNKSNNTTIFFNSILKCFAHFWFIFKFFRVFTKSFLFRFVPISIESSFKFRSKGFSPYCC